MKTLKPILAALLFISFVTGPVASVRADVPKPVTKQTKAPKKAKPMDSQEGPDPCDDPSTLIIYIELCKSVNICIAPCTDFDDDDE